MKLSPFLIPSCLYFWYCIYRYVCICQKIFLSAAVWVWHFLFMTVLRRMSIKILVWIWNDENAIDLLDLFLWVPDENAVWRVKYRELKDGVLSFQEYGGHAQLSQTLQRLKLQQTTVRRLIPFSKSLVRVFERKSAPEKNLPSPTHQRLLSYPKLLSADFAAVRFLLLVLSKFMSTVSTLSSTRTFVTSARKDLLTENVAQTTWICTTILRSISVQNVHGCSPSRQIWGCMWTVELAGNNSRIFIWQQTAFFSLPVSVNLGICVSTLDA